MAPTSADNTTDTIADVIPMAPYLREIVWGGRRLADFGKDLPPDVPIGESFEISALPGQESVVRSGPLAGSGLRDLLARFGADLVGDAVIATYGDDFPLLIKLIDAQDDLSIQVHPDDGYARAEGLGRFGKTEAWYVLRSDAARLALGLQDGIDADSLRRALMTGDAAAAVRYQPVGTDDVVFLRAGTVHALCRGIMVYEVQQSSDLTFRLYDYGRPGLDGKPRELHIDRGLAVTDFSASTPTPVPVPDPGPQGTRVVEAAEFSLDLHGSRTTRLTTTDTFAAVTVTAGSGCFARTLLSQGDTALIPAGRVVPVTEMADDLRYLVATPGVTRNQSGTRK